MANIRIYNLAKELEISNKEILEILEKNNIKGKTASSGLEPSQEDLVRRIANKQTVKTTEKVMDKKQNDKDNKAKDKQEKPNNNQNNNQNSEQAKKQGEKKNDAVSSVYHPQNSKTNNTNNKKENNNKKQYNKNNNAENSGQKNNRQGNNNQNHGSNGNRQGNNRPNQGGNRPNQGNNRPNQGGNRPNQGNNRPNNKKAQKPQQQQQPKPQEPKEETIKTITIPESLSIKELADKMKVQPSAIVKMLFLKGTVVTINTDIDFDTAEEIALEYNCICEKEEKVDVIAELLKEDEEDESKLIPRPPVVCVMGHVDHGKTSLLDAIRDTHVIDKEAGGITQHIGAYVVSIDGQKITFLDTPGHEAFTAMRMRGANSTDIAILVVAADDGVMPQTVEAINHAKAADIEIIVAINKIDKPSANIERVKQELAEYELVPEDWGGSTVFVPVSAHTHEGIDDLLEMILLTAEVSELKANPKRKARGLVIEAELDKGRGPVATVLVQKGTLSSCCRRMPW